MAEKKGTQAVFDEDEEDEIKSTQAVGKEEETEEDEEKEEKEDETPSQKKNRLEYEEKKRLKEAMHLFDITETIPRELILFKKIPRTPEEEFEIAKKINKMVSKINPFVLIEGFGPDEMAKIYREFYDMPKIEYIKDGNGQKKPKR